jgi:hypothetical protein
MAVTEFQSDILRVLADLRRQRGESYVAGGVALNVLLAAPRRSHDIDLFHDTETALQASWAADRDLLRVSGYDVKVMRELPSFVEAVVARGAEQTAMQWAHDSAFRFFPLVEDDLMGLALHPFDLATNKVLAMAGRLVVRDWIDVMNCDARLQPWGYLVWAACGKDPGLNPLSLLSLAARMHYSQVEVDTLEFEGEAPSASVLGRRWHEMQAEAEAVCALLPYEQVGTCVVRQSELDLFRGRPDELRSALAAGGLLFHEGRIGGSWPSVKTVSSSL